MSIKKIVADFKDIIGENPLWNPHDNKLYWVDIPKGCIYHYDPKSENKELFYKGEVIGGFTIQTDGSFLLFGDQCSVKILRDSKLITLIAKMPGEEKTRFNDVIADPQGRVFCGTPGYATATPYTEDESLKKIRAHIYRLDTNGSLVRVIDDIGLSNGFGFTPDKKQLYYTDSLNCKIFKADYNEKNGELSNHRIFVTSPQSLGIPDGMTVDKEGCVWSAHWDGACVIRYTPDGEEDLRIQFPTKKVTSIIFGGKNYTDIYITTAGGDKKDINGPASGALFHLNLGIEGVPEYFSSVGLK
jgi:sugar lactone lactonase YvrE